MNFCSDNVTGVSPEILQALAAANAGAAASYGADAITERLQRRFAELFEHEVAVFPVATGTAANALALATLTPPYGVIYCHGEAHFHVDECGAPEFYTGGAKLTVLGGEHAKITPAALAAAITGKGVVHHVPASGREPDPGDRSRHRLQGRRNRGHRRGLPAARPRLPRRRRPLRQCGGRPQPLARRPHLARRRRGALLRRHQERRHGGGGGGVLRSGKKAADFAFRRKRGGHLFSKMRFLSAQLDAYLADDLWLRNARHANRMAARLAEGLAGFAGARLRHPVEANEIFVELPEPVIRGLFAAGFLFHRWGGETETCVRLVTAFDTAPADVEGFLATAKRLAAAAPSGRPA